MGLENWAAELAFVCIGFVLLVLNYDLILDSGGGIDEMLHRVCCRWPALQ